MLQARHQTVVLLLAVAGCAAGTTTPYPDLETVELSRADRAELLAAPLSEMNNPASAELSKAIQLGAIDNIKVDKSTSELGDEEAARLGRNTVTTYQGWIRYSPVTLSDSRVYKPVILCVAHEPSKWVHCQDESWIRLQTRDMPRPIRFNGELSDAQVAAVYDAVDDAALVSTTDNQQVTSDRIYQIIKYPQAGNRVNVYVTTEKDGYTDVIYLAQVSKGDGQAAFEVSDFRCGGQ